MKILFVTSEFGSNGGGLSLSSERVFNYLSERYSVQIVNPKSPHVLVADGGYNQDLASAIRHENDLKIDACQYKDIDYVIAFGGSFNGYYASILAQRINSSFILCLRGTDVNLAKWSPTETFYLRESAIHSYKIVCLSKEMIENLRLIDNSLCGKCVLIPNSIVGGGDVTFAEKQKSTIVIGTASTHLNEKKGIANLISLVKLAKEGGIDINLELVGEVDADLYESYVKIINDFEISDRINFHGRVSRSELSLLMKDWDLYVQASVCEGHPNSVIEALENGVCFISTRTGYIFETLHCDFPEFFFEDNTPASMLKGVLALLNDKKLPLRSKQLRDSLLKSSNSSSIKELWYKLLESPSKKAHCAFDVDNILSVGLHDVQGDSHDSITTPIDVFRQFVDFIYNQGMGLCSMRYYLSMPVKERQSWIVCTFDDGYAGLYNYALPILSKYGFSATVFICTSLIGKDNKWNNKDSKSRMHLNMEELSTLNNQGWEIASHGVHHYNFLKLTDIELEYEIKQSKEQIDDLFGPSDCFAYPYGANNAYIQQCVALCYKYAFAVNQGGTSLSADAHQLRRYSLSEIYKILSVES
jgi:glycosyltransferase involved in cell wall biosynthesis